jgi:hypothetical protein
MGIDPLNAGIILYEPILDAMKDAAEGIGILSGMEVTAAGGSMDISISDGYAVDG